MALLISDYLYPERRYRRSPFGDLFHDLSLMDSQVNRKNGVFSLNFQTSEFKPEELDVNVAGDSIVVEGHHAEETEGSSSERHFCQKFRIPIDVDPETVESALDARGNLTVSAKIKTAGMAEDKRRIPISMFSEKMY